MNLLETVASVFFADQDEGHQFDWFCERSNNTLYDWYTPDNRVASMVRRGNFLEINTPTMTLTVQRINLDPAGIVVAWASGYKYFLAREQRPTSDLWQVLDSMLAEDQLMVEEARRGTY